MLIIGDTHLHNFKLGGRFSENGCNQRLLSTLTQLRKAAQDFPGEPIIQLGDLHHVSQPEPAVIGAVVQLLHEWVSEGREVILIAGNHDASATDKHALQAYQGIPGVTIVGPGKLLLFCPAPRHSDEKSSHEKCVLVGWTSDTALAVEAAKLSRIHNAPLICHAALLATGHTADTSTEAFTSALREHKVPIAISGHLHGYEDRYQNGTRIIQLGAFQGVAHGEWEVGRVLHWNGTVTTRQYRVPAVLRVESFPDAATLHVLRKYDVYAECSDPAIASEIAHLAGAVSVGLGTPTHSTLEISSLDTESAAELSYMARLETYAKNALPNSPQAIARVLTLAKDAMGDNE